MKIGIVGGTGNISQSIVQLMLERGHEVVCFNCGESAPLPRCTRLIQGNRNDRAEFECLMQAEKFDAAIDMICFNSEDAKSSVRAFRGVGWFVRRPWFVHMGLDMIISQRMKSSPDKGAFCVRL